MSTTTLQDHARQLLESSQVACVIGYEVGPRGITRPAFVRDAGEVHRLVWNDCCTHNLVGYLKEQLKNNEQRVAVVVKPCDSKAINVLLAENRFDRERLHIIGVTCQGIVDQKMSNHGQSELIQARCGGCELVEPVLFDELIGEPTEERKGKSSGGNIDYSWIESAPPQERNEFWIRQFERCIRCYACRQVCPACDCPTCAFEREDSLWVGSRAGIQEKRMFHLGRAYHLAGRCVGCNECERVCPMDIPLSLLNQFLANELEMQYQHKAGFKQMLSPLTTAFGEKE